MKLIIGLGNPDKEYELTRHNTGFMFIDYIAKKYNVDICKKKNNYLYGEGIINGDKVALIKPTTYMNLSGNAVIQAKNWYKVELEDIIIVYDDIDLPLGEVRFKIAGSTGTHNGMKNIIQMVSSENINRIRIGIENRENKMQDLANYVLGKFNSEEIEIIKDSFFESEEKLLGYVDN